MMKAVYCGYAMMAAAQVEVPPHIAQPLGHLLDLEIDTPDSGFSVLSSHGLLEDPLVHEVRKLKSKLMPEVEVMPSVYTGILLLAEQVPIRVLLWLSVVKAVAERYKEPVTLRMLFSHFVTGLPSPAAYEKIWADQAAISGGYNALSHPEAWK